MNDSEKAARQKRAKEYYRKKSDMELWATNEHAGIEWKKATDLELLAAKFADVVLRFVVPNGENKG